MEVEEELFPEPEGEVTQVEVPEVPIEPYFEIQMLPEDPEVVSKRKGVHERIQMEMYHKAKEVEAEEQLEAPLGWSKVPDLMMETRRDNRCRY